MLASRYLLVFPLLSFLLGGCVLDSVSREAANTVHSKPERLFLQQIGKDRAIVKWRGAADQACVSETARGLKRIKARRCVRAEKTAGNHKEALFTGLAADTSYYYSVGNRAAPTQRLHTAPAGNNQPADGNTRIWILGDSGTATMTHPISGKQEHQGEAAQVRDGFLKYNAAQGGEAVDLLLMLGDNAYMEGTDAQWQQAVFELYPEVLAQTPLWPTIGNHEMGAGYYKLKVVGELFLAGTSTSSDPNSYVATKDAAPARMPYLDIFSLPTNGETGGVASGTEQYYSFDYGNVHVVSLDSQLSTRDPEQRAAMRDWLTADLASNSLDWTIVIFHHPPYTRGSHDSDKKPALKGDIDTPIVIMREEFTPVFEDYGVDLVFSGHSHSYERSWYLTGHTGDANTFNHRQHTELNTAGEPASGKGAERYAQISHGSDADDKVVYTVAGSSGHVSLRNGKLDHPAHSVQANDPERRHGLAELGSVVVDADARELTARFVDANGAVRDSVTITR